MAGSKVARGRLSANHARHWASAWGCDATRCTSASAVPGLAARTNLTETCSSATITSTGSEAASASSVAFTPPSSEFSIGTTAAVTSPERTASKQRPTVGSGTRSTCPAPLSTWSRAASVKVPTGPRKAYRAGAASSLVTPASVGAAGFGART